MIATAPAREMAYGPLPISAAQAQRAYDNATHRIRRLHTPHDFHVGRGESWEDATANVVLGLNDSEAVAILRYLVTQGCVVAQDVMLAEALASRLGQEIHVERREIVERW